MGGLVDFFPNQIGLRLGLQLAAYLPRKTKKKEGVAPLALSDYTLPRAYSACQCSVTLPLHRGSLWLIQCLWNPRCQCPGWVTQWLASESESWWIGLGSLAWWWLGLRLGSLAGRVAAKNKKKFKSQFQLRLRFFQVQVQQRLESFEPGFQVSLLKSQSSEPAPCNSRNKATKIWNFQVGWGQHRAWVS